ncbi:MAG: hypothetical protein CBE20_00160 [Gammaproteobacteria bacterium TMED260]|nr:hypothetical protein [Gammaproteobacteria bacterium]OUX35357.1 MAG: hypothetical protein CBE20_00160 [Gammaproteobacteria bacterium TMED260]
MFCHELAGNLGEEPGLSEADDVPLWYRGLAQNDAATELAHVDALLGFYDDDHIVIGHTPGAGVILPRFEGKVLIVDTGLFTYYGAHGASLLIEGDEMVAQQDGERYSIPQGEAPPAIFAGVGGAKSRCTRRAAAANRPAQHAS